MLTLSLHQPWASLLVAGEKRVETRSWPLKRPLPCVLAIHAAKKWNTALYDLCWSDPFYSALRALGIPMSMWSSGPCPHPAGMPFGAIVGMVRVREVLPTEMVRARLLTEGGAGDEAELQFGDYSTGRWAWVCNEFFALPLPIPCVGRQGLFQWAPPLDLQLPEWAKGG